MAVRLAALSLLLVHSAWAHCILGVRVCVPELCGSLRGLRRAATELMCGPCAMASAALSHLCRRCRVRLVNSHVGNLSYTVILPSI